MNEGQSKSIIFKSKEITQNSSIQITNEDQNEQNVDKNKQIDNEVNDLNTNNSPNNYKNIFIEEKKIKISKHKIFPICINNCIIWTLKAHLNFGKENKTEMRSNYLFKGKSLYFIDLDYGLLNALNNNLSFEKCFPKDKNNFDSKKKILEKLKQESIQQISEGNIEQKNFCNASLKNIIEGTYPIKNYQNYNIINTNLCIKENLNNVFLLKFDLKNGKDNNNEFRLINDDCVKRDINFALNGEFHGNKIFKNDLTFNISYREFIKTIQFKLDDFKHKILEHHYYKKHNNRNYNNYIQEKNKKIFYGKIINNVNLGIEFLKPQTFDKLQTNFNSIVNAEIELTKIFIELTIPNSFLHAINENNEENLTINNIEAGKEYVKKKEIPVVNKFKDMDRNIIVNQKDKFYIPPPPPFIPQPPQYIIPPPPPYIPPPPIYQIPPPPPYIPPPPIYIPPHQKEQSSTWGNLNFFNIRLDSNGIPLPPPFEIFNQLMYKNENIYGKTDVKKNFNKKNLPNVTFDYLSLNNNIHKSPSFTKQQRNGFFAPNIVNYSPLSTSYLMVQPVSYFDGMIKNKSLSFHSSYNLSNLSSPYLTKKQNYTEFKPIKKPQNLNQTLFDNLLGINNQYQQVNNISNLKWENAINSSGTSVSSLGGDKQQNSSNDTDLPSLVNQNINNSNNKMNPLTIKQIILEPNEKKIENNYISKNFNRCKKKVFRDSFVITNQGKSNFEIFIQSVSPLYKRNINFPFLKFKIMEIFNKFKRISLFGLKNVYCFNGELINVCYLSSLSSLSIKIENKTLMNKIILELKKNYKTLDTYVTLKQGEELTLNIYPYIIYFSMEYIQICFSENKPYQYRKPFIKTIEELCKVFPFFDEIIIDDLNLIDSTFSIMYFPLKCSKHYINYTSFVVYYQFTKENIQDEDKVNKDYLEYDKQTIVGILPIKLNTYLYFQRIIIYNYVMNISPLLNYFSPYFNKDTIMIKSMVYSVINDVVKHLRGTSYDYEYFMKINKRNSFK